MADHEGRAGARDLTGSVRRDFQFRAWIVVGIVLISAYILTLAPGVTLWDSGEFLAAIRTLGIPHPPGTPLYVLVGNIWGRALGPIVGFAAAINLLSALFTAGACALIAALVEEWSRSRLAGICAGLVVGGMSTVWLNATETEVYAASLFLAMVLLWVGNRAGRNGDSRWIFLLVYLAGLGAGLHLTALVTLPAALWLAAGRKDFARSLVKALPLAVLGASVVAFMLLRARHDPAINQGNPDTLSALADVVTRAQYSPAPLWPRQAPWFIQIGNVFEYADWQIALGFAPDAPPSWRRTPFTIAFGLLGAFGFRAHRRIDRRSWGAMTILLLTATLGVIAYLNLKAGPSFGAGFVPEGYLHEARERDYFFAPAFACWGLWSGIAAAELCTGGPLQRMRWTGLVIAAVPLVANWSAVDRSGGPGATEARSIAAGQLARAAPNAVLFARGDNDTYPLWYLQQVEGVRKDVIVVTLPMLAAGWYRAEIARRHALLDRDSAGLWQGVAATRAKIMQRASQAGRPVIDSNFGDPPN